MVGEVRGQPPVVLVVGLVGGDLYHTLGSAVRWCRWPAAVIVRVTGECAATSNEAAPTIAFAIVVRLAVSPLIP